MVTSVAVSTQWPRVTGGLCQSYCAWPFCWIRHKLLKSICEHTSSWIHPFKILVNAQSEVNISPKNEYFRTYPKNGFAQESGGAWSPGINIFARISNISSRIQKKQCLHKGPQLRTWSSWGPNCWNGPHLTHKASFSPFPPNMIYLRTWKCLPLPLNEEI